MKNLKLDSLALKELNHADSERIKGGKSVAYWIGYGVGKAARFIQGALESLTKPPSTTVDK